MTIFVHEVQGKGRGVFADKDFNEDEVIERCHIIFIPRKEMPLIKQTILKDYYFDWGDPDHEGYDGAIVLGHGSLYNHSFEPNAYYDYDEKMKQLLVICGKPIKKGEEITFNYNGDPDDRMVDHVLWFLKKDVPEEADHKSQDDA
ncbi:SET domain-containing protein-lysine N-methyltransferase [Candidatus Woesearchaeota archaeon]|nr:SET domain-containing protein-lysine N-methyltransferase [Candidatus Woesearchaeota archaeon]